MLTTVLASNTPTPTTNSPGSSIGSTGVLYIDSLIGGSKWGGGLGTAATVTYSFPDQNSTWAAGYNDPVTNFQPLNERQQAAFGLALQSWANVANITFVKVDESPTVVGDIRVGFSGTVTGDGHAYMPPDSGTLDSPNTGDVWIQSAFQNRNFVRGDNEFDTFVHELGHAIGLKHPFDPSITLPSDKDNMLYSDMSYTRPTATRIIVDRGAAAGADRFSTDQVYPSGPMLYDVAAIQTIYGANTTHATGNDTYTFTPYTPFLMCIWDAGGNDTINASNMPGRQIINLNAGAFSSIGLTGSGLGWVAPDAADAAGSWLTANPTIAETLYTGRNNLSIAYGAVIENAIGGAGDDTLTGNAAANILTGGAGNDTIDGGDGIDTAVFHGAYAQYRVTASGGIITVNGPDGTDTLTNIERLQFDSGMVDVASLTTVTSPNAIYRFYNAQTGTHFYTNSLSERNSIQSTLPSFQYEGVVFASTGDTGHSVWRFYNSQTGTHFYTISDSERDTIRQTLPQYTFEGEAYKASTEPGTGLEPLYRFYNTQTGAHFFTANAAERDNIISTMPQFHYENTAYYVAFA